MNTLTCLVANVEFTLQNDLGFVVGIGVNKWSTLLEPVEASADRLFGIRATDDVAQVCVLVGDQRWLELGLRFREMLELQGHFYLLKRSFLVGDAHVSSVGYRRLKVGAKNTAPPCFMHWTYQDSCN